MNVPKNTEPLKKHCENHEKCMQMIQAVLDGSATEQEIISFKANMGVCLPCIEGHDLQKSIKEALQQKIEKKCCPESTLSNIRQKLGIASALLVFAAVQITIFKVLLES
ncbi:MAG: hypothetical protein NWQ46_03295 [Spirosomaceae bacterium]|nr:hypothetical protein [Spirosomataceae bacterium]